MENRSVNYDIMIMSKNGKLGYYDFKFEDETDAEAIARVTTKRQEDAEADLRKMADYPEMEEFFKKQYEAAQSELNAGFEVVTWEEYKAYEKSILLDGNIKEVTAEEFDNALNVLPPLKWCTINGVNMFCMSEMYTASYTTQYARYNGKYYCMMVNVCDTKTWIHNYINKLENIA